MAELLWLEGFSVEKAENKETESWAAESKRTRCTEEGREVDTSWLASRHTSQEQLVQVFSPSVLMRKNGKLWRFLMCLAVQWLSLN